MTRMLMTHCFVYSLFPFFQRVPRDHHVFPLDPLLRERFVRGLLLLSSFRSIHGRCYNLTLIPPSSRLNDRSENIFFLHAYQTTVPLSVNTKWMQPSPKPWPYNPPRAPKGNESKKSEPCYVNPLHQSPTFFTLQELLVREKIFIEMQVISAWNHFEKE